MKKSTIVFVRDGTGNQALSICFPKECKKVFYSSDLSILCLEEFDETVYLLISFELCPCINNNKILTTTKQK